MKLESTRHPGVSTKIMKSQPELITSRLAQLDKTWGSDHRFYQNTRAQTSVSDALAAGATAPGSDAAAPALLRSAGCCSTDPHRRNQLCRSLSHRRGGRSGRPGTRWDRPIWPPPSSGWPRGAALPPQPARETPCRCPTWWLCPLRELHQTGASLCPPLLMASRVAETIAEVIEYRSTDRKRTDLYHCCIYVLYLFYRFKPTISKSREVIRWFTADEKP